VNISHTLNIIPSENAVEVLVITREGLVGAACACTPKHATSSSSTLRAKEYSEGRSAEHKRRTCARSETEYRSSKQVTNYYELYCFEYPIATLMVLGRQYSSTLVTSDRSNSMETVDKQVSDIPPSAERSLAMMGKVRLSKYR